MRTLLAILLLVLLTGCVRQVTQQGNVLKPELFDQVSIGDSRYRVENLLGAPMLNNTLNPRLALYVEDYYDPSSGKKYLRRVEIKYDDSGAVETINRSGFEDSSK